jgi:hypothetical protein
MRRREPTSTKSSPSVGPDALIALVRLLARQAAREFALHAPAHAARKGANEPLRGVRLVPRKDVQRLFSPPTPDWDGPEGESKGGTYD